MNGSLGYAVGTAPSPNESANQHLDEVQQLVNDLRERLATVLRPGPPGGVAAKELIEAGQPRLATRLRSVADQLRVILNAIEL